MEIRSLVFRFHSYIKGNEDAFRPLLINLSKECINENYGVDKPLTFIAGVGDSSFVSIIEDYEHEKVLTGYTFGLKE